MMHLALPAPSEQEIDALLAEMQRLGTRDYPEIGVPMFLVAEDLTVAAPARAPGDGTGRLLAMLLADGAAMLRARKAELSAEDLAGLIEALADRHFLGLGAPAFSCRDDLHPAPVREVTPDPQVLIAA